MAKDYKSATNTIRQPQLDASGLRIGIVVSRFNSAITQLLLEGALDELKDLGAESSNITVTEVPGAFELPQAASILLHSSTFDAIICLGCVIRGETSHYDYICQSCATGLETLALESGVPMIFGVVTTENIEQAEARSGGTSSSGPHGHKGRESAQTAVEMALLATKMNVGVRAKVMALPKSLSGNI